MLHEHKMIGRISVFTSTEQGNFWKTHLPDATIYGIEGVADNIEKILNFQADVIMNWETKYKHEGILPQHLVILDDFSWHSSFSRYNETFARLFTTGRWYNTAVIILVQSPTGAMNWVRQNSDFVFIFKSGGEAEIKRLWTDHFSVVPEQMRRKFYDDNTIDYNVIVVDKSNPTNKEEDNIYKFKATDYGAEKIPTDERIQFGDPVWRRKVNHIKKKKQIKKESEFGFEQFRHAFKNGGFDNPGFMQMLSNN